MAHLHPQFLTFLMPDVSKDGAELTPHQFWLFEQLSVFRLNAFIALLWMLLYDSRYGLNLLECDAIPVSGEEMLPDLSI